ncbi:putative reverse transcriptase domain-containing protein [Tanacetum coccineum]
MTITLLKLRLTGIPHLTKVGVLDVDVSLEGSIMLCRQAPRQPNIITSVSSILDEEENVNITSMSFGRIEQCNIMVIGVDEKQSKKALNKIDEISVVELESKINGWNAFEKQHKGKNLDKKDLAKFWKVMPKDEKQNFIVKRLHLSSDERKGVLREAISRDHGLYMAVEETLKVFNQWLCGKCMDLHAVSRACHYPDGLVRFSKGSDDMSGYIVGISKPSNKESGIELTEGLVFDAELLDRAFKVPITTVKCIPHGCRLAFSQALKTVLCKVVTQLDSIDAWVSSILKSLAMWRKDDDITMLVKSILDGSVLGSFGQGGGDFLEEGATGNTNIKQCLRKVMDGHFTAAIKVLSSSGVAPYCDDTIKALEAKHPYKPPPSMPSITFSEPPLIAEIDSVFSCIKSFPKGTSCERDGLRAQHILDALCGEGSATAKDLLKVITSVVNLWLAGRCPPILAEFIASAPLTPLLKLDNGIRPITVGTIWRRLVSKVAMKGVGKKMSKYLSDFQFRVGVLGGAKAILHSVNQVLSEYHNDGSLAMLTLDFSNAFNLVDRSALLHEVRVKCPSISLWVDLLYGQASRLYVGDTHIWSATGVQQGDPLGPFLFALILHPLLHKIKDSCKLLLHAWYLDDGTIIGDSEEVSRVLDIIKVSGPDLGLELNIKKTEIFWPSCNGMKLREGLFPVDIRRPSLGVKLLEGGVSKDAYFISGLAMR